MERRGGVRPNDPFMRKSGEPNHTVPSGTDAFVDEFQAINCLATIT
jgi:hypothetical protein